MLYVLWGCTLIALSFFTSCFFSSARTAAVACFLAVFASGLLGFMLLRCVGCVSMCTTMRACLWHHPTEWTN